MDSPIILVGGFSEVIELAEDCGVRIVGLIDPNLIGQYRGYPVLGTDDDAALIREQYPDVPVFIGLDLPAHRMRVAARYAKVGFAPITLVHPDSHISRSATTGNGVMIQRGANLSAGVWVGSHVRVNVNANLMHDVTVGMGSTIAPNAVLLGRVAVGLECYIGSNATILPELSIGDGAVVGAGAVVTKSVPAGMTVVGNPARELKRPRS